MNNCEKISLTKKSSYVVCRELKVLVKAREGAHPLSRQFNTCWVALAPVTALADTVTALLPLEVKTACPGQTTPIPQHHPASESVRLEKTFQIIKPNL